MTEKSLRDNSLPGEPLLRVLIVDDEVAVLFAYKRLIEGSGYEVDVCESLAEAIQYITTRNYFVVITDLRLTGSDTVEGLDVLAAVREHQPQARMLAMTGYCEEETVRAAVTMNATFYFKKPLDPAVILETLRLIREEKESG